MTDNTIISEPDYLRNVHTFDSLESSVLTRENESPVKKLWGRLQEGAYAMRDGASALFNCGKPEDAVEEKPSNSMEEI